MAARAGGSRQPCRRRATIAHPSMGRQVPFDSILPPSLKKKKNVYLNHWFDWTAQTWLLTCFCWTYSKRLTVLVCWGCTVPRLVWLNGNIFSHSSGDSKSKIKMPVGQVSFWSLSPWLGEAHLPSVFTWCFLHVCVCVHVSVSSSKDTSHIGLGLIYMNSLSLNYLCEGPILRYNPILRYWGLGLQHTNRWDTIQPVSGTISQTQVKTGCKIVSVRCRGWEIWQCAGDPGEHRWLLI